MSVRPGPARGALGGQSSSGAPWSLYLDFRPERPQRLSLSLDLQRQDYRVQAWSDQRGFYRGPLVSPQPAELVSIAIDLSGASPRVFAPDTFPVPPRAEALTFALDLSRLGAPILAPADFLDALRLNGLRVAVDAAPPEGRAFADESYGEDLVARLLTMAADASAPPGRAFEEVI